jgi:peptide/nickel transport system permease protein
VTPPAPPRPAPWIESLVPGFGHLRRGFPGPGLRFLAFAVAWLLVLVFRWSRLWEVVAAGGGDAFLCLLVMVGLPVLLVVLAHASLGHLVSPPSREGLGTWALAWRDLRRNPRAVWGMSALAVLYLASLLAPVLSPFDPIEPGPGGEIVHKLRAPGAQVLLVGHPTLGEIAADEVKVVGDLAVLERGEPQYRRTVRVEDLGAPPRGWARGGEAVRVAATGGASFPYRTERYLLGTDTRGRDLLSRLLHGSRISLFIGFVAMVIAVTLGVLFGSVAGYFGGLVDGVLMRVVDILLAFPRLLLLLLIVSVYEGAGIFTVIAILGATGWMGVSRLVRAEFLKVKQLDYAHAAKAMGFARLRIMFRHLLPNAMAPVIVNATLLVGNTILVEAALSFLGFGVQPPQPSWGNIISDGQEYLTNAPWISTIPGVLIVFSVTSFNLVGDALRDALDPKQRR